jgi:hypothetical protein
LWFTEGKDNDDISYRSYRSCREEASDGIINQISLSSVPYGVSKLAALAQATFSIEWISLQLVSEPGKPRSGRRDQNPENLEYIQSRWLVAHSSIHSLARLKSGAFSTALPGT